MKTIWKVLVGAGLLIVLLFSGAIGKLIGKSSVESYYEGKKRGSMESALLKAASELNAKLPMMVDAETRLDSSIGLNNTLRYNYTLINHTLSTVTAEQIDSALGEKLVNNVCTSREMQVFVKNGVTVTYAYYGSDGGQITVIAVPPSKCGRN